MKTRIEYRLMKFKKKYNYNTNDKTTTIKNYFGEELKILIDLDIWSKTMKKISKIPSENGEYETVYVNEVRETSATNGPLNLPIIYITKEFFESKSNYSVLDNILYHEIAHLKLNTLNLIDGIDMIDQYLTNTSVMKLWIDFLKETMDKRTHKMLNYIYDFYVELFGENDKNTSNSDRYKIIECIINEYNNVFKTDQPDIKLVFEVEADLFSISNQGYDKYLRFYMYDQPKQFKKELDIDAKDSIMFLQSYSKLLINLLNNDDVRNRLYIYKL